MRLFTTGSCAVVVSAVMAASCGSFTTPEEAQVSSASASGSCANGTKWLQARPKTALDQQVLNFAQSNLSRTVGSGECSDLAQSAIATARGKPFYQLGPSGQNADYVWGDLRFTSTTASRLAPEPAVSPGEVIQFKDASFKWYPTPTSWQTANATHHTAIVSAVSADGKSLCVLEQNSGNRRYVTYGYYAVSGLQAGTMRYFGAKL